MACLIVDADGRLHRNAAWRLLERPDPAAAAAAAEAEGGWGDEHELLVRFEINRPLTGMGHERYVRDRTIEGHRPVDELARRLFAHGGVDAVHIYDNMVTADLSKGADGGGLIDVIRELFLYYRGEPSEPPTA